MKNKFVEFLLNPIIYFVAYFFIATTTLHHQFDILLNLHIEFLIFLCLIISTIASKKYYDDYFWKITLFSIVMIMIPLISSYSNNEYGKIINDGEYSTFIQTLILLPFIFTLIKNYKNKSFLIKSITIVTFILSIYFEYRYLILNEQRDFDGRPLIKIRHGDANFLCAIISFVIPFSILLIKKALFRGKKIEIIFYSIMTLNLIIAVSLTQSRMGIIAIIIGLTFLFIKKEIRLSKVQSFVLIMITLLSLAFFGKSFTDRLENIADKSNADRILTYQNGIKLIKDSPYLGVGMHNAKNFFYSNTEYPHFQSEFHQLDIHNTYLKIFSELGVVAFLALLYLIYLISKSALSTASPHKNYLISSLIIILISSITIGISYKDFYYIELIIIFALTKNTGERIC